MRRAWLGVGWSLRGERLSLAWTASFWIVPWICRSESSYLNPNRAVPVVAPGPRPRSVTSEPSAGLLARGAALHGANGMTFDRHDRLHIASVAWAGGRGGGPAGRRGLGPPRPRPGVEGPDDLTFGPDGALYWTSYFGQPLPPPRVVARVLR